MFTDTPLAGNGLAVVHDAEAVSDEVMLAFARETRLVETTFVQPPTVDGADYRNRIWTPMEEMPFAGHPSLGTAVAVALERGEDDAEYRQQTHAGIQPVRVERAGDRARASVLQEPAVFGAEPDPGAVLAAAGLASEDAHPSLPPQFVSTGLHTLVVPVADAAAVSRARADRPAIAALGDGTFNLYLAAVDGDGAPRALLPERARRRGSRDRIGGRPAARLPRGARRRPAAGGDAGRRDRPPEPPVRGDGVRTRTGERRRRRARHRDAPASVIRSSRHTSRTSRLAAKAASASALPTATTSTAPSASPRGPAST